MSDCLSVSETKSGRIGDAIRPGLAPAKYGRRFRRDGLPENPYSMTGASGFDCSSLRKIEVDAEDAARQIRRHGQGSPVGSKRPAFHNAMAIAVRLDIGNVGYWDRTRREHGFILNAACDPKLTLTMPSLPKYPVRHEESVWNDRAAQSRRI